METLRGAPSNSPSACMGVAPGSIDTSRSVTLSPNFDTFDATEVSACSGPDQDGSDPGPRQ